MKLLRLAAISLFLVAGCSVFPGLRVLTGEDTGTGSVASIDNADIAALVMADKTGATDPSLMAAADRIEAAAPNVDVIEIRKDEPNDRFVVSMLFIGPQDADPNTQAGLITIVQAYQRAMEVTWQGTAAESDGTDQILVRLIAPLAVDTLDSGLSFVGAVDLNAQIDRSDMLRYMAGSRSINDFVDMIVNGTLSWESPSQTEWYDGQPNHPIFMLDRIQQAAQAQGN